MAEKRRQNKSESNEEDTETADSNLRCVRTQLGQLTLEAERDICVGEELVVRFPDDNKVEMEEDAKRNMLANALLLGAISSIVSGQLDSFMKP